MVDTTVTKGPLVARSRFFAGSGFPRPPPSAVTQAQQAPPAAQPPPPVAITAPLPVGITRSFGALRPRSSEALTNPPPPAVQTPPAAIGLRASSRFGMGGRSIPDSPLALPRHVAARGQTTLPQAPVAKPPQAAVLANKAALAMPAARAPMMASGPPRRAAAAPDLELMEAIAAPPDEIGHSNYEFERVNDAQVKYRAVSTVNPTGAVIPRAMAAATLSALLTLEERVGSVDDWLCGRLRWSRRELGQYLTSEQIDGVALALDRADRGEGLIIADQTGFGKGRIVAATARAIVLDGKSVIFLTEKGNLFSDFWRDIRDIGSDAVFGRPFLLNDPAKVHIVDTYSPDGRILFPRWKKAEIDRAVRSGAMPAGCKLMMATYSQFNRKDTLKSRFIVSAARKAHMMVDESHNFVGDSNTSQVIGAALDESSGSTFSSATFARGVGNLAAYSSVMPWLKTIAGVEEMPAHLRRALAEESVRVAATSGRIIRREHDLTNMVLHVKEEANPARCERNEVLADRLGPILSSMAFLGRRVFMMLEERNEENKGHLESLLTGEERKAERELWFTANFGSRLAAILSQFLIALKVDACVEECVASLLRGEKPVVVIEATVESLMRELQRDTDGPDEADEPEALQTEMDLESDPQVSTVLPDRPPTFKAALTLLTDRLLKVTVRRGATYEKEEVYLDDEELVRAQALISAMVADFPDLSLSPIDDLRDRVEERGRQLHAEGRIAKTWVTDEISARSMRVVDGRYVTVPSADRNKTVARFNNGAVQMLVLTPAASTGLSIHDSEKFEDHAIRHMIELSMLRNVLARIQMWGRVWRRGQLTEPRFTTLSTGLPFESYEMAAQNRKVAELCASVTGSSKTSVTMDVPDFINSVGNDVAHDFLSENQTVADAMCISLNIDKADTDKEFYFVSKLLRRVGLLRIKTQKRVFAAFVDSYKDRVRAGANPNQSGREMEGIWRVGRRDVLEPGDGTQDPMTGRDVLVTTIHSTRETAPLTSDHIRRLVTEAAAKVPLEAPFKAWAQGLQAKRADILQLALAKRDKTVVSALRSGEDNTVKRADQRVTAMVTILSTITPGTPIRVPALEDEMTADAIVIDIRPPPPERVTVGREYEITFAVPGEETLRVISLDAFVRNNELRVHDKNMALRLTALFDLAPRGSIPVQRKILDGNGLGAILAARQMNCGSRVTWRIEDGGLKNGILLPKSAERKIVLTPSRTHLPDVAASVLQAGARLTINPFKAGEPMDFYPHGNGGARVVLPSSKRAAKAFETDDFLKITGPFNGDWREREVVLSAEKALDLLILLAGKKHEFNFEYRYRRLAIEKTRELAPGLASAARREAALTRAARAPT